MDEWAQGQNHNCFMQESCNAMQGRVIQLCYAIWGVGAYKNPSVPANHNWRCMQLAFAGVTITVACSFIHLPIYFYLFCLARRRSDRTRFKRWRAYPRAFQQFHSEREREWSFVVALLPFVLSRRPLAVGERQGRNFISLWEGPGDKKMGLVNLERNPTAAGFWWYLEHFSPSDPLPNRFGKVHLWWMIVHRVRNVPRPRAA